LWDPAKDLKHRTQVHKPEIGVHSKQPSQSDASTGDGEILRNSRSAPQQQNPLY
jgi:hypothetical protein